MGFHVIYLERGAVVGFHVIYLERDGWMWQSYEADAALPLPPGVSQPEGHAVATLARAPTTTEEWVPATLTLRTRSTAITLESLDAKLDAILAKLATR